MRMVRAATGGIGNERRCRGKQVRVQVRIRMHVAGTANIQTIRKRRSLTKRVDIITSKGCIQGSNGGSQRRRIFANRVKGVIEKIPQLRRGTEIHKDISVNIHVINELGI